jgi:hypothetical protein
MKMALKSDGKGDVARDDSQFDGLQLVGTQKVGAHLRGDRVLRCAALGLPSARRSDTTRWRNARTILKHPGQFLVAATPRLQELAVEYPERERVADCGVGRAGSPSRPVAGWQPGSRRAAPRSAPTTSLQSRTRHPEFLAQVTGPQVFVNAS